MNQLSRLAHNANQGINKYQASLLGFAAEVPGFCKRNSVTPRNKRETAAGCSNNRGLSTTSASAVQTAADQGRWPARLLAKRKPANAATPSARRTTRMVPPVAASGPPPAQAARYKSRSNNQA